MAKAKKTATKKKAAPRARTKKPTEVLVVGSKVKAQIKDADCNTAGDALEGLNEYVHWLINQATARAKANNRKTVRAHDFVIGG